MPTRFAGKKFTFTQPDGSQLQVLGFGDQNYAVFETLDGKTVVKNPATGYYEVAQLTPDRTALVPAAPGQAHTVSRSLRVSREAAAAAARASALRMGGRRCDQRREERRRRERAIRARAAAGGPLLAPPERQTVGDFVGLCLLIDFSDAPATIDRAEVARFCNEPGYKGFGNNGSVRDYFFENSLGRCRYTSIVAPYYRAQHPKTYYTDRLIEQPIRAYELIEEALAHHQANGFDFSPLTVDEAGYVYAMNVYYAGPVTNNWAEGLWPHSYHLEAPRPLTPGKQAFDYQFTAMGAELELGTFCHENGHMLCDYPDLYDYGGESSGVGLYCLMCAGNFDEKNPIAISAYLKRLSGWAGTVTPLEHGSQVTLASGSNDFAIHSRNGREYFLIENRQKAGRDSSLPDAGLAVWHIDEEGDNQFEDMTGARHYELSLLQADGRFDLERTSDNLGDSGDLFAGPAARLADGTTPNTKWWSGAASNLTIEQISASGPSMSFRALLSTTTTPPRTISKEATPNKTIPDNNSTGITSTLNIEEAAVISSIRVGVNIEHPYRSDLQVSLLTPWGTRLELHPYGQGGSSDDLVVEYDETSLPALATLRGKSARGAWTLRVRDLALVDVGRLERWRIEISSVAPAPRNAAPDSEPEAVSESEGALA